ncbi:MAG: GGDEF domain-containing protein [bacterium]|nr:GGDEF domain-containing protein [bacterium]
MENNQEEQKEKESRKLNEFQIRNISILTHLLMHDAVTDEIVENLRKSELDYFSLINKYKLLEQKVNIDEKTNLLKFKKDYLTDIIKTASRIYHGIGPVGYHVSLVRFDIDDFSIFNNKYGHDLGDEVLVEIANTIRSNSRPTDYVIRFGGEEMDALLPSTDIEGTITYLDKIYECIRGLDLEYGGDKISVTVSAGVSSLMYSFNRERAVVDSDIEESYKRLQNEADNALYEAKYLGKDQYCIYTEEKKADYSNIRKLYVK